MTAGLAIYDTMQYIKCPVATLGIGQCASMGSLLLAAGEPGERRSLPHTSIMMHQPSGGASGPAEDIMIRADHISKNTSCHSLPHSDEIRTTNFTVWKLFPQTMICVKNKKSSGTEAGEHTANGGTC